MDKKSRVIRADVRGIEQCFIHPLATDCEVNGVELATQAGLERVGLNLFRVPPGKASFPYHAHHGEEEWLIVISGRGRLEIDTETYDIGPGDFVGFPPMTAHRLFNPDRQDLVYLSGGERIIEEIIDYPRQKKRTMRKGKSVTIGPLERDPVPASQKKM